MLLLRNVTVGGHDLKVEHEKIKGHRANNRGR
jgi:hypothetical protein